MNNPHHTGRLSYSMYEKESERILWDMRGCRTPNITPASTVLNSPDLTDLEAKMQYQTGGLMQHHQIKVGRSPVGNNDDSNNSTGPSSPTNYMQNQQHLNFSNLSVVSDGEMVVFDDIDSNWQNKNPLSSPVLSDNESCLSSRDVENYYEIDTKATDDSKGQRIIEYEESPRRYGLSYKHNSVGEYGDSPRRFGNAPYQHNSPIHPSTSSNNVRKTSTLTSPPSSSSSSISGLPKPGFPQRVITPTKTSPTNNGLPQETNIQSELIDFAGGNNQTTHKSVPFDYLYEFSETRKVLEEFFTTTEGNDTSQQSSNGQKSELKSMYMANSLSGEGEYYIDYNKYVGQRLASKVPSNNSNMASESELIYYHNDHHYHQQYSNAQEVALYVDSGGGDNGKSMDDLTDEADEQQNDDGKMRNFTLSPETTDYDSNCGDIDSEMSLRYIGSEYVVPSDMNGLRTGNIANSNGNIPDYGRLCSSMPVLEDGLSSGHASDTENNYSASNMLPILVGQCIQGDEHKDETDSLNDDKSILPYISSIQTSMERQKVASKPIDSNISRNNSYSAYNSPQIDLQEAIKDIQTTIQKTKALVNEVSGNSDNVEPTTSPSPVWVPRQHGNSKENLTSDHPVKLPNAEEEDADTDLETDRLLGQQRLDDENWCEHTAKIRPSMPRSASGNLNLMAKNTTAIRQGVGTHLSPHPLESSMTNFVERSPGNKNEMKKSETSPTFSTGSKNDSNKSKNKEGLLDPAVLIEGVLFRARYLGSTQLVCEGQPTKTTRMMQAEEAVSRIKALAPEGESQPSTEVDLFISTEKIMVLNTDLKEIMMDHALRTISYIADIGDLVVLMARRRFVSQDQDSSDSGGGGANPPTSPTKKPVHKANRTPKMICHVFESEEAQFIAQSIGQAFQVAYMEFLKANGIEDHSFMKEMDYQEVLNSQEIFGDELEIFAKKELQKEVVVPKAKGEILGVVIVESGWGSMLPTVVIANLSSTGAAARCGQLNIGDQIIAINGLSLVGLPLSTCQSYIKNTKNQTAVKFTVVPCPPVVEVKIKRPNTKYQLGFSVQNGVICSLLRGGIAERGGVRVGHRIIEINNQSVVAVPHEKIVNLLATSVGEILMKTMPTSMFRLLTGQENPIYI